MKSHDEDGNCAVCFLIQAESVKLAETIEAVIGKYLNVHRPVNSGRHVYSAWDVVNSRIGGHHRHWDCFRHPQNKKIKTNYGKPMPRTDDYLRRTVLCSTPYGWSRKKIRDTIEKINGQLRLGRGRPGK